MSRQEDFRLIIATVVNSSFNGGGQLIRAVFIFLMRPASIVKLITEYGRTDTGVSCSSFRQKSKARNGKVSALGVCGFIEVVLQVIPVAGHFTADIVVEIIEQQILPLLPRNVFLVADNASIHDEPRLCTILRVKNITVITLPAFAYDLNPIEMVFAQAKAIAHYTPGFVDENTLLAIVRFLSKLAL